MQLNEKNENMEIMLDYEKRTITTLGEMLPDWWGRERCEQWRNEGRSC